MVLEQKTQRALENYVESLQRTPEEKLTLLKGLTGVAEVFVASEAYLVASRAAAAKGETVEAPEGASLEWARGLDWLCNPPHSIKRQLASSPELETLWHTLAETLPSPRVTFTDKDLEGFDKQDGYHVSDEGVIVGFGSFQEFDVDWSISGFQYLLNLLDPSRIASFENQGKPPVVNTLEPQKKNTDPQKKGPPEIKIAIIGDWGTGQYSEDKEGPPLKGPAFQVMATLRQLKPDYIIHLGDVYYAGTAENDLTQNEEKINFLDMLRADPNWPDMPKKGLYAINSNHEQYGAARGLLDEALNRNGQYPDSPFQQQNGRSFFSLQNDDWAIIALDSAYFDTSTLYMDGSIGKQFTPGVTPVPPDCEQSKFIAENTKPGQKVIIMTHHTGLEFGGDRNKKLWDEVTTALGGNDPDYWYWGHLHLGIAYNTNTSNPKGAGPKTLGRCVGHSAIPFGNATGLEKRVSDGTVAWYANTSAKGTDDGIVCKNGFAMITLTGKTIKEEFYDAGSTTPVWTAPKRSD